MSEPVSENEKGRPARRPVRNLTSSATATTKSGQAARPCVPISKERAVYIRSSRGGFTITVEPPLEVDFDTSCTLFKGARGYADMVGRLRSPPVLDLTEGGLE